MILGTVSAEQMRMAQIITGIVMAILIGVRFVPPLSKYAAVVCRTVVLLYLVGCLVFIFYAFIRAG